MIPYAAKTHPGLRRPHNEDSYEADPELKLWLVADGIGGHSNGEVASRIVTDTVKTAVAEGISLDGALRRAHEAILEEIDQRDTPSNMGSTAVALSLDGENYRVAWVGDSRAYLWDGAVLTRLTRDHSKVGALLEEGLITESEAASHPGRHILIQSLGVTSDMPLLPEEVEGTLGPGQQILLCSDGLSDELSDEAIIAQLFRKNSTQTQVTGLVEAALAAGGSDNITVVLVGDPPPDAGKKRHKFLQPAGHGSRGKIWLLVAALVVLSLALLA